ncbi:MAG: hypothetical protein ACFE0Q_16290 [Anaerolineae bacterium]
MQKLRYLLIITVLIIVACQPQPSEELPDLPTIVQFPTETATSQPSATPTLTETPLPTETTTVTSNPTETPEPTHTPPPTETSIPTDTLDPTQVIRGTATASVLEAPIFSTFTPIPPGALAIVARPTSTGTPEVLADVIITEAQFQEEVNRLLNDLPDINQAQMSFVPEGIAYRLTADNGEGVLVTGTVTVPFTFSGGSLNNIVTIGGGVEIVMDNEPDTTGTEEPAEIPEAFLVNVSELVLITQESFNFILNQRLGEGQHDLENLSIIENRMLISLVVPLRER